MKPAMKPAKNNYVKNYVGNIETRYNAEHGGFFGTSQKRIKPPETLNFQQKASLAQW